MITGKKEELDQYIETHRCPEHDNPLVVAWHALPKGSESQLKVIGREATPSEVNEGGFWVLRCGHGHFPEEVVSLKSRTQQFKQGELEVTDKTFNLLPAKDLGSNELLTPDQINGLIAYARKYGLDAYRGHVMLMYGVPYIGIDGYLYHANQEKVNYSLRCRPMHKDERTDYQVEEGDHAWLAFLDIEHGEKYFVGTGIVRKSELTEMSKKRPEQQRYPVVAAHPWQLAQKRAEWQAMRRGFPIGDTEVKKEE